MTHARTAALTLGVVLLAAAPEGVERLDELVAAATGGRSRATPVGERWVDVTD